MRIVVLIKEVPDTYGDRRLSLETGLADRAATESVLDEISERALEVALTHADAHAGTEVVAVTMGPSGAEVSVRKALALGATEAVHVVDDGLVGADTGLTAEVLADVIKGTGYDLVIAGDVSTDGSAGVMPAMVAELLGVPHATALASVEVGDGTVRGIRATDEGMMTVSAPLPAVISITERLPDVRFASFQGIKAAKTKPYQTLHLAELGVQPEDPAAARSIVLSVTEKPPRKAGTRIVDEGDAGERLADFLAQNKFV